MNVKEITDQAIELSGVPIDAFKSRRYINEAIQTLATQYDTACINATTDITCTDINAEYPLPDDCIGVTRIIFQNRKFTDFIIEDGNIIFDYVGTFTIRYIKNPILTERKVYQKELNTDIPSINLLYHRALPFYVASQVLLKLNPNDPKITKYSSDFNSITQNADAKLNRQKRKGARIKAPLFR